MIFHSDKFIFDGISSMDMGIRLVDTVDKGVLMPYGVPFVEDIKMEHSYGENPFYTHKQNPPEKITLEFCLVDKVGSPIEWTKEIEEKVVNWFMIDKFGEFISYDYPDLVYYFRGVKASRVRNADKRGILSIEFQPYYKYPVKKYRKNIVVMGEKSTEIDNPCEIREFVYPVLEVTAKEDGDITIINESIEGARPFVIKDLKENDILKIDNKLYIVTDDKDINKFNKVNREWFKLKKGVNKIKMVGNARIKFLYNLEVRL